MSENNMKKERIVILYIIELFYYIYRGRSLFEFVCIRNIREWFSFFIGNGRVHK